MQISNAQDAYVAVMHDRYTVGHDLDNNLQQPVYFISVHRLYSSRHFSVDLSQQVDIRSCISR